MFVEGQPLSVEERHEATGVWMASSSMSLITTTLLDGTTHARFDNV